VSTVTLGYYPMPREPSERLAAACFRAGGHRLGYLGVLRAARGLRLRDQERRLYPQPHPATTQCLRSQWFGYKRQKKRSKDENQARTTFHRSKSNRLAARLREDRCTGSRIDSIIFDAFWPFNLGTPPVPWAFNAQGVPKAVPSFELLYHGPVRGTEEAPKK